MQTITNDIVGAVARALITLHGTTSSLDVKTTLRQKGYWAKQEEVRSMLADIATTDGDLTTTNNGTYLVYTFTPAIANTIFDYDLDDVDDLDDDDDLDDEVVDAVRRIHHASDNVPADYRCYDITNNPGVTYNNVTRPQAKAAYSKQYGVPFLNVRTKKLV